MDTSKDSYGVQRGACSCTQCHVYVRPSQGYDCDYCGCKPVAHANLTSPQSSPSHPIKLVPPNKTCQYPGCAKPVFVENGRVHDYCGKTHARMDASNNNNTPTPPSPTCKYSGCTKPVFVENGKVHDYCGRTHAKAASPKPSPSSQTTGITLLQSSDSKYQEIEDQFIKKWLHPKNKPVVQSIAKIHCSSSVTGKFETYRQSIIQKRPEFQNGGYKNGGPGNEQRRFHGTNSMKCNLGLNSNSTLCNSTGCATCSIIRVGFQLQYKAKWGRFGEGIYLTSTSSKSDDYNAGTSSGLGSGIKAMFVCKVIVGKGKKLTQDDPSLTAAPSGFDSVLGETGVSLKYDEVIVYNEDAILPAYLIIYQS